MNQSQELTLSPSAYRMVDVPRAERETTIRDFLNLLSRRRAIIFSSLIAFVAVAIVLCAISTRRYLATAEIQVQKENGSQLGLENPASGDGGETDAVQDNIALQTQVGILESDSLALKVIRDLKLYSTTDFKPRFSILGWALGLLSPPGPSDAQLGPSGEADLGLSPRQRTAVLSVFSSNLGVRPIEGTRLIKISYLSSSPRLAAEVVNRLADGLRDYNFETRHSATARTAQYLTEQLTDLRKQSEALQAQVARAQRDSGIVSLGGIDATGREQVYSAILDKLQQATSAYTQAQSNRIAKDAVYDAVKTGDPEAISSIGAGNGLSTANESGFAVVQALRLQQAALTGQLAETSAKFGPAFPKLAEMQQQLDALNNSLKVEIARMSDRAKNDAEVAKKVEQNTRKIYTDLKSQADAMNDKTIAYTIMRQEAEQSRTLYETLFKQLKEAGVLADFKLNNISIVDPARVPATAAKPNVPMFMAAALTGGLFFGCIAAFLRDVFDNKIRSLPDLENQIGQLPLGVLPFHSDQSRKTGRLPLTGNLSGRTLPSADNVQLIQTPLIAALRDPRSAYIEAIRALRTSILLSRGGAPPKVILVTSSVSAEGKSMLSINLATVLAQQGKKVLLVDGDFRRPTIHRTLKLIAHEGLSSYLAGHTRSSDPFSVGVLSEDVPGLTLLPAGPIPPYPAELLGSEQMRAALQAWKDHFDFVIIDGAPVLPVTDSVILSTIVDFTLLIARYEFTERQSLDRSYRLLHGQAERGKVGIVLNAVQRDSSTYYQYYGYKDSVYYGNNKKYV